MDFNVKTLTHDQYSYKTLQDKHAFRLLKLLPGDGDALGAELHEANLTDPNRQAYDALSYTWGDPAHHFHLHYQEWTLPVTRNLDMALRRLRHAVNPRWLWVDAVCIDQSNHEEKSHQIGLMRSIYSNSAQTVCFIGEEAHESRRIIELAEQVARKIKERAALSRGIAISESDENRMCEFILGLEPRFLEEAYSQPESEILMDRHLQSCLMQIIIRPYFRRAWTVQEFIIPPKIVLLCGECVLSWYGLWYLVSIAYVYNMTYQGKVQESDLCINQIRQRCRQRAAWWIKGPQHLQDMLNWMRTSEATQPVDKVYSVLPLTGSTDPDPEERSALHVNYSEPVCTTYTRFARYIIEHGDTPRLLYDASRNFHSMNSTTGLPSWVPDWQTSRSFYSLGHVSWRDGGFYQAGGSWNERMITPSVSNNGSVLRVSGMIIDMIKETGSSSEALTQLVPEKWDYQHQLYLEAKKIQEFARLTRMHMAEYVTGESIETVIWKTVVGNELGSDYTDHLRAVLAMEIRHLLENNDPQQHMNSIRNDTSQATVWGDIMWFLGWRRFALTEKGYIGLVHQDVKANDRLCLIPGAGVPFVLRPSMNSSVSDQYVLIGETYIHGIMSGEACPENINDWKTIEIC